ncbi:MAG: sigma-70 family RNA polymerase sigma factor [Clostridia bacterium]
MCKEVSRDALINRLVNNYSNYLLRICYVYLRDMMQAQDAVQDTFLKAIQSPKTFHLSSEGAERAWLTRIASNTCKDYIRSAWHRHISGNINGIDMDMLAQHDTHHEEILPVVMSLPLKQREVVLAYYYEGLNMSEISKQLSISKSAVHYRMEKAKKALRQSLNGGEIDE